MGTLDQATMSNFRCAFYVQYLLGPLSGYGPYEEFYEIYHIAYLSST